MNGNMTGETHMGEYNFGGGSEPRGHNGIAPLDMCHYIFLVPEFWFQFSRILLSTESVGSKKLF